MSNQFPPIHGLSGKLSDEAIKETIEKVVQQLAYISDRCFCGILQPNLKAIKKRIEDLITRDYLERDKENPNLFKYLA